MIFSDQKIWIKWLILLKSRCHENYFRNIGQNNKNETLVLYHNFDFIFYGNWECPWKLIVFWENQDNANHILSKYRKVTSSRLSRSVAHPSIFRLFMKGRFDAYVLRPLAHRVWNWIVDRSTARDFTVCCSSRQKSSRKNSEVCRDFKRHIIVIGLKLSDQSEKKTEVCN